MRAKSNFARLPWAATAAWEQSIGSQCSAARFLCPWSCRRLTAGAQQEGERQEDQTLPTSLALTTIWGANTGVGKTLASVGLAHAAKLLQIPLLYVKPVQTGFPQDSDARLVAHASASVLEVGQHAGALLPAGAAPSTSAPIINNRSEGPRRCKVEYAWAAPVSPHLAVRNEGRAVSDREIVSCVVSEVHQFNEELNRWRQTLSTSSGHDNSSSSSSDMALGLVETAGGVASPGPSGKVMCDVLRPLRLPALLVGDPRLGGISSTVSAYESLILRGYDVDVILIMDQREKCARVPPVEDQIAAQCGRDSPDHLALIQGLSEGHKLSKGCQGQQATTRSSTCGTAADVSTSSLGNAEALIDHLSTQVHRLGSPPVVVISIPGCLPPDHHDHDHDHHHHHHHTSVDNGSGLDYIITQWLKDTSPWFMSLARFLQSRHEQRVQKLMTAKQQAMTQLWWPFTQHAALKKDAVQVVDSRCGEQLTTLQRRSTPQPDHHHQGVNNTHDHHHHHHHHYMTPLFDAASSWWTQAVTADLQPEIARAVAYAAGRYLHVISPQVATQASLEAASRLLQVLGGSWATRVFFSDDGSTAIEVALKMAFRTYLVDRARREGEDLGDRAGGRPPELKVIGLRNAYHGDTLGAMDCVPPSVFNAPAQAPWYRGRGLFLDPPYLAMGKGGTWRVVELPDWLTQDSAMADLAKNERWSDLTEVTGHGRDESALVKAYRHHIDQQLSSYDSSDRDSSGHLAALIIEPLVQGAGGMMVVDPLFQKQLVQACRARHIPIIFDEVMTGLYRVGGVTAASLLREVPDIACYAKLMTAGVVPGAATLATEKVFDAFQRESKLLALLHGHSYTAFPVGCAATVAAIDILTSPKHNPNLCSPSGRNPTCPTPSVCKQSCGNLRPMWDQALVSRLCDHPLIDHVMVVGTIVAAKLKAYAGSTGYASTSSVEVVTRLRDDYGVYARPLGDVVYIMVTPTTQTKKCDQLLDGLIKVLDSSYRDIQTLGQPSNQNSSDGVIV